MFFSIELNRINSKQNLFNYCLVILILMKVNEMLNKKISKTNELNKKKVNEVLNRKINKYFVSFNVFSTTLNKLNSKRIFFFFLTFPYHFYSWRVQSWACIQKIKKKKTDKLILILKSFSKKKTQ